MKTVCIDDELRAFLRARGVSLDHKGPQLLAEGKPVIFEPPVHVTADFFQRSIRMGAFSYAGAGSLWDVEIGRYVSIAEGVRVGLGGHPWAHLSTTPLPWAKMWVFEDFLNKDGGDVRSRLITNDFQAFQTTRIGNDVWIGAGVYVRDGVTIGDGAVVGAQSVVTKDVPPYAIVGGAPAQLIRMRFSDDMIERLQRLQWWRYSIYDLPGVDFSQPEEAVARIEALSAAGDIRPYAPDLVNLEDLVASYEHEKAAGGERA